ncbi:MAG: ABC transporter permease, partial [Burkholderia sp.]|nr:ABC transporter permease [Burkholderia sp.]
MHPTEPVHRSSALPPSGEPRSPWGGAPPPATPSPDQPRKRRAARMKLTTGGRVGLSMVSLMLFIAVFAPLLAPHDLGAIVTPDVFA